MMMVRPVEILLVEDNPAEVRPYTRGACGAQGVHQPDGCRGRRAIHGHPALRRQVAASRDPERFDRAIRQNRDHLSLRWRRDYLKRSLRYCL